jgi:hypothetical protein
MLAGSLCAADITGIWMGPVEGRNGEKEDVSFQFKSTGNSVTGKVFGDEHDLPVEAGTINGDQISFASTSTNYYSGGKQTFLYTGVIKSENEIELTRQMKIDPKAEALAKEAAAKEIALAKDPAAAKEAAATAARRNAKTVVVLKRIT